MAKRNLLVSLGLEDATEDESASAEKEPTLTHVGVVLNKVSKTLAELARGTDTDDADSKSKALLSHIDPTLVPADASQAFAVRNNTSFQYRIVRVADMYDLQDMWGIPRRKVTRTPKNGTES